MKAGNWIDRIKSEKDLPSDYAAAKALGLSRFTVSGYRQRPDATLDENIALKVAQVLEINPALVLADQAMERAKNEDARSAWSAILERLGGMAGGASTAILSVLWAIVLIASIPILTGTGEAVASQSSDINSLYIV